MSSSRRRGSTFFVGTIFSDEQQGCLEPQKIWYCHKDCSNDAECYYIVGKVWIHTECSTREHHHSETFAFAIDKISRADSTSNNTDEECGWVHSVDLMVLEVKVYRFLVYLKVNFFVLSKIFNKANKAIDSRYSFHISVQFFLVCLLLSHQMEYHSLLQHSLQSSHYHQ